MLTPQPRLALQPFTARREAGRLAKVLRCCTYPSPGLESLGRFSLRQWEQSWNHTQSKGAYAAGSLPVNENRWAFGQPSVDSTCLDGNSGPFEVAPPKRQAARRTRKRADALVLRHTKGALLVGIATRRGLCLR